MRSDVALHFGQLMFAANSAALKMGMGSLKANHSWRHKPQWTSMESGASVIFLLLLPFNDCPKLFNVPIPTARCAIFQLLYLVCNE